MLLATVLGGCGFHLRGSTGDDWHLGKVYLQGPGAVASEVQRLLLLNRVPLAATADAADTILTITRDSQDRQVLSVDPDTGKVREFELTVNTGFRVTAASGEVLLEDDAIALDRDYTFDETAALGKYEEESALYGEIRKDVAAAIIRRLQPLRLPATPSK